MINLIDLVLSLLGTLLTQAKANNVAVEVVDGIEAAVKALEGVQGTPVTYGQLESIRVKPTF